MLRWHGSGPPLKVLCDGTFVHHLVVNDILITPPYDAVSNLLGAKAMLFTTRFGSKRVPNLFMLFEILVCRRPGSGLCSLDAVGHFYSSLSFIRPLFSWVFPVCFAGVLYQS